MPFQPCRGRPDTVSNQRSDPAASLGTNLNTISDSPTSYLCLRTGLCTNDDGAVESRAPRSPAGDPAAARGAASPSTNDGNCRRHSVDGRSLLLRLGRIREQQSGRRGRSGDKPEAGRHRAMARCGPAGTPKRSPARVAPSAQMRNARVPPARCARPEQPRIGEIRQWTR
jgi:hypothetical protein